MGHVSLCRIVVESCRNMVWRLNYKVWGIEHILCLSLMFLKGSIQFLFGDPPPRSPELSTFIENLKQIKKDMQIFASKIESRVSPQQFHPLYFTVRVASDCGACSGDCAKYFRDNLKTLWAIGHPIMDTPPVAYASFLILGNASKKKYMDPMQFLSHMETH